jgi:hypothetical protein
MLKEGQIIRTYQSGLAEVILVNESRARVRSLNKRNVEIYNRFTDEVTVFTAPGKEWDISPNSTCEVIQKSE